MSSLKKTVIVFMVVFTSLMIGLSSLETFRHAPDIVVLAWLLFLVVMFILWPFIRD